MLGFDLTVALGEPDEKALNLPSADMVMVGEHSHSPRSCCPAEVTETRVMRPVSADHSNALQLPVVAFRARFVAVDTKATRAPSADMVASRLSPLDVDRPSTPVEIKTLS